jgi:hypothetical protein
VTESPSVQKPKRSGGWQGGLLSSSVPLEYEVARLLKGAGLHIVGEWLYQRTSETGAEKEPSVDLRAVASHRVDSAKVACTLDVLVECKYRHRNITWLFLPHPDDESSFLHSPLEGVDHFAPWFIRGLAWDQEESLPVCYKGVEIGFGARSEELEPSEDNKRTNARQKTLSGQIRHGLYQLQFALPAILALRVRAATYRPLEELAPFYFIPLLVTNAQLVVANPDFSVTTVERASTPEDLGRVVPALTLTVEPGPELYDHARRQLADLPQRVTSRSLKAVEEFRQQAGFYEIELPSWLAQRIAREPADVSAVAEFSNFLVCNREHLASIIDRVIAAFVGSAESISKEPLINWNKNGLTSRSS